jgi:hypothetical protein
MTLKCKKKMSLKAVCATVLGLVVAAEVVSAQRSIPDDNLAYPVLITLRPKDPASAASGASASGFFLNTGDGQYLVTARHTFFDLKTGSLLAESAELISYPGDPKDLGRNHLRIDLTALFAAGYVRKHLTQDVTIVRISTLLPPVEAKQRSIQFMDGVQSLEVARSGLVGVEAKGAVKEFDRVLVGNQIILFGYPRSLGMARFPQLDPDRPLLRRGTVAGVNPSLRLIVLDCSTYPGNSGGPVVEIEEMSVFQRRFSVIGVLKEFVPYEEVWLNLRHSWTNSTISNSGYSIATPMDYVLELLPESEKPKR